ncbi:hypothetical protein SprV_0301289400 [Sparganum proliferum]
MPVSTNYGPRSLVCAGSSLTPGSLTVDTLVLPLGVHVRAIEIAYDVLSPVLKSNNTRSALKEVFSTAVSVIRQSLEEEDEGMKKKNTTKKKDDDDDVDDDEEEDEDEDEQNSDSL